MNTLDAVKEIVSEHLEPGGPDDLLEIDSFTLIALTETIEERFGIRVAARELTAANFGTLARIAAYVEGKR